MTQRIGFLLLPRLGLLPLAGAVDALLAANALLESPAFEIALLSVDGRPVGGEAGGLMQVAHALEATPPLAGLIVASDSLPADGDPRLAGVTGACRGVAGRGGVVGGIGTGAAWIAPSGLLRGHRWTVSRAHVAELAGRHPDSIVSGSLYEIDRSRLSCGGGTASLDMMIAWLGLRHGERFAQRLVAHFGLERLRARDEGQRVASAARLGASPKLVEAVALMEANIGEPLTTEDIARLVGVSRRQLERLFRQHLDALPSRWYLELRLERARRLLQESAQSILQIGLSCGFSSAPHFSNAYRSRFGRTPRDERRERAAAWRGGSRAATPAPTAPVAAPAAVAAVAAVAKDERNPP
jgi:transcriptional regulator GlxA family with amidase domain